MCFCGSKWAGNVENERSELHWSCATLARSLWEVITHFFCYLRQPDVLLLNGVLQTVAEGSGQQQICRLADHVVHLRGAEDTQTHRGGQRISGWAQVISSSSRCCVSSRQYKHFKWISQSAKLSSWKKSKCQPIQMSTLPCYELSGSWEVQHCLKSPDKIENN